MAQKLHYAVSTYNKIERGETEITVKKLQEIADILGVSKQYIEEYDPAYNRPNLTQTAGDNNVLTNIATQFDDMHEKVLEALRDELCVKNKQIDVLQNQVNQLLTELFKKNEKN